LARSLGGNHNTDRVGPAHSGREPFQEESPLSTRVHELAKELGLKSQDLLDRIQGWGLDVKPSIFAGLAQDQVDRIRGLLTGPAEPATPQASHPSARPSPTPSETPAISPTAPVAKRPTPTPSAVEPAPPLNTSTAELEPAPAPAPIAAKPQQAPEPPAVASPPGPARVSPTAPAEAAPLARPPAPAPTSPAQASPRPGGLTSPPRLGSGGGPLSRHTPNRGGPGGSDQGGPQPQQQPQARPSGPSHGTTHSARAELRPNPATPPPLKPSDYISPAGVRSPINRPPSQPQGDFRRGDGDSGGNRQGDGPGRGPLAGGGARRPLPPVAASSSPSAPPRRPDGPRPGGASEVKTQRPERRFTPEEMRRMMQSGQIGGVEAPPAPSRPGQAPARPGGGGPSPSSRFGAPPAAGQHGQHGQQMRGPSGPGGGPGPGHGAGSGPALRRPAGAGTAAPPPMIAPPIDDEEEKRKAAGRLGTPADRAGRRAKRNERANERRISSPLPASALTGDTEEEGRGRRGGRKPKVGRGQIAPQRKSHAEIEPPITVRSLSEAIGVRANDLIRKMMNSMGQMITINANLEDEAAQMLALEFGVELQVVHERTAEDDLLDEFESRDKGEETEGLVARPPIITILGHVDHGKTSLLDKIRHANVVDTESGGITQHIGAYQVVQDGHAITFVDTPGHEAFTAMRARGANVTDIVVLVVAADDGVMPQTQEAIAHAKAAGVPIVIALNKIDLPNVNLNKIYGELSQQDLAPEEYGGDTPVVKTSALTGKGIPELLEMLAVVAELKCDLRANPDRPASGTCLESSISEGRGVVATVLVQDGTLRVGDAIVCGDGFGRVRALFDDKGRSIQEAGPSMPVEVSGLDAVPTAGEKFAVIDDITKARDIVDIRRNRTRGHHLGERQAITLENLYDKMAEQKIKNLNLILKADVQGSLEALVKELDKLENAEVPIRILLKGVGGISESDILLADASQAIVIGFRVAPEDRAVSMADDKKIDIRRYDIIYQVTDEIKKAIENQLVPEYKEVHLGRAVVRETFKISKVGTVAGCFVTQGVIERSAKARLIREGREIYKGGIEALKRFKDDAKEVREGFECGIKITNYDDIKNDDVIEAYRIDVIRRTL
jgi:translation initiation factor IF-2